MFAIDGCKSRQNLEIDERAVFMQKVSEYVKVLANWTREVGRRSKQVPLSP